MLNTPSANAPDLSLSLLSPDAIRYLVVHCSDTPDDEPVSARDIHQMHLGFGWHGVGYHRIINRDGTIEAGRPEYWTGAHVYGFNTISLGVCLIGRTTFTAEQKQSLKTVLKQWKTRYPTALICGHCQFEYTEKTCPNFDIQTWVAQEFGVEHAVSCPIPNLPEVPT